jgi:prepilin peptidase CpaA
MPIAALSLFPFVLTAAVSDIRRRRVSNRLNLTILAAGLVWRAASLNGWFVLDAFAGVGVGLAILFIPFAARWVGAGDVKLLAACGAWLGPFDAMLAGLFGLLGGGVLAAAIAASGGAELRKSVTQTLGLSVATLTAPVAPRRRAAQVVPLAVPIAAAACAILLARGY